MKHFKKILLILVAFVLLLTGCNEETGEGTVAKAKYKITFDSDGGSEVFTQEVEAGNLAQKPTDPTKSGYAFDGWQYNGEDYDFNKSVSSDMTLKAKWVSSGSKYTVRFDSDGGSTVYSITVNENEKATKPTDPTKDGYVFKYWSYNDTEYDFESPVTANIELKAVWSSNTDGPYTVKFDSAGGTEVADQTVKKNKKATAPKTPTKTGYVFLDWTLDGKVYSFSTKVTADITLVATWAQEGNYTVRFDTNGSEDVIASQIIKAGKLVSKPKDPVRDGWELKEWQFEDKPYDFNTKVSQDMVLKAIWQLPHFDVTFDSAGGSTVKTQSIEINKTAKKPTNPTKTGYTFKGWFIGETEYEFTTPVTAAITLVAHWEVNKYMVDFDSDGGSDVESQLIEYGAKVSQPANPTKDGWVFEKWQLNGTTYNFDTKVTKAITLKAVWTKAVAKTYTFKIVEDTHDTFTTDYTLEVYENGTKINFTSAKLNGNIFCYGTAPFIERDEANDARAAGSITVVLTNGQSVTATYTN